MNEFAAQLTVVDIHFSEVQFVPEAALLEERQDVIFNIHGCAGTAGKVPNDVELVHKSFPRKRARQCRALTDSVIELPVI
jgi:hypothetical protein